MTKNDGSWGVMIFIFSPLLITLVLYLHSSFPPEWYRHIVAPLGLLMALLTVLTGHFSYPRVANLKVYLVGHLTGLMGIAYFIPSLVSLLSGGAPVPSFPSEALVLLTALNLILALLVPRYVKYRQTRLITGAIVLGETALLILTGIFPELILWFCRTGPTPLNPGLWGAAVYLVINITMSIKIQYNDFSFGGVLSGAGLLTLAVWFSFVLMGKDENLISLFILAQELYIITGILIHWVARMEHRVTYDPLLQIYNRDYCTSILEERSGMNTAPPCSIAMVDIDHFKKVNDTWGHQAGDAILFQVAQTIQRSVIPEGIVCRYGGEEIIVFFLKTGLEECLPRVELLRRDIEKLKVSFNQEKLSVTVSCGLACRMDSAETMAQVIERADKALYQAKDNGRNQVRVEASKR